MFPRVVAPIAVAPPVLPTNMIVDTSVISLIMAVKIIGEAKLASGASLVINFPMIPDVTLVLDSVSSLLLESSMYLIKDAIGSIEIQCENLV